MTDAEIDAQLTKACSTDRGSLKAGFVLADLQKLAPMYADPATRPAAEQHLEAMQASPDPLRKSMAMAWLARARSAIAGGVGAAASGVAAKTGATAATQAVGRGYDRLAGKAGDLGAAAGEKLARSPLNAKRMAAAKQAGGEAARDRMAERLAPAPAPGGPSRLVQLLGGGYGPSGPHLGPAIPGRMSLEPNASPRLDARGPQLGAQIPGSPSSIGQAPAPKSFQSQRGPAPQPVADRVAAVHADALAGAFRSGAAHAADRHARTAARMGRVAARHSFKVGMQLAGAGAAVAAAGTVGGSLSQAQHEERVNAARAPRHRGTGTMGAQ